MSDSLDPNGHLNEMLNRYIDAVRLLASEPAVFFQRQSHQRGYLEPTVFALIHITVIQLYYALLTAPFTLGLSLVFFIPSVVYQFGVMGFLTVILLGSIRLFEGQGDLESVYRSTAYAGAAMLLLLIPVPFLNLLLSIGGMAYLFYFALLHTHGLKPRQCIIVLVIPVIVLLTMSMIITVLTLFVIIRGLLFVFTLI